MNHTTTLQPTQTSSASSICSSCPYFEDFNQTNGRGWCKVLDTLARKHHPKTQDCHWAIASHEKGIAIEELPPCPYEIGQLVKVIEAEVADSSQWQTFVVVGRKYNSGRYRSTESYLEETNWDFGLKASEETPQTSSEIWISEDRLCTLAGAARVNAAGEF